jgi:hypothetical protein
MEKNVQRKVKEKEKKERRKKKKRKKYGGKRSHVVLKINYFSRTKWHTLVIQAVERLKQGD